MNFVFKIIFGTFEHVEEFFDFDDTKFALGDRKPTA